MTQTLGTISTVSSWIVLLGGITLVVAALAINRWTMRLVDQRTRHSARVALALAEVRTVAETLAAASWRDTEEQSVLYADGLNDAAEQILAILDGEK